MASRSSDLPNVLQRFGEAALAIVTSESSIKTRRTIISESGRSDIGMRFYETGPKIGIQALAFFFQEHMETGIMRQTDALVAAQHFLALLDSETVQPCLMGTKKALSKKELSEAVHRAVDAFLGGYGSSGKRP